MKNKLVLLTGMAVGYVLGTRAGREQYEKIREQAMTVWNNPKVQEQVSAAQQTVKEQAPAVQEKLTGAAKKSGGSEGGSGSGTSGETTTFGSGTAGTGTGAATGDAGLGDTTFGQPGVTEPGRPEPGTGI